MPNLVTDRARGWNFAGGIFWHYFLPTSSRVSKYLPLPTDTRAGPRVLSLCARLNLWRRPAPFLLAFRDTLEPTCAACLAGRLLLPELER